MGAYLGGVQGFRARAGNIFWWCVCPGSRVPLWCRGPVGSVVGPPCCGAFRVVPGRGRFHQEHFCLPYPCCWAFSQIWLLSSLVRYGPALRVLFPACIMMFIWRPPPTCGRNRLAASSSFSLRLLVLVYLWFESSFGVCLPGCISFWWLFQ